jgi:hypothetical protein
LSGDLEVDHRRGAVAADLEGGDDEVGAGKGAAAVGRGFDLGGGAHRGDELAGDDLGFLEPLGVDVHQREGGVCQRGGKCSASPTMFFMNTVDPAPMKAMRMVT